MPFFWCWHGRPRHCPAPCGAWPFRGRNVPCRPWSFLSGAEEIENSLGVLFRQFDIRDMRGIEGNELGPLDLLLNRLARGRWRGRILLADNHERRRSYPWV